VPVDATGLQTLLEQLAGAPPASVHAAAQGWAAAVQAYAAACVPASAAVASATPALASALEAAFATPNAAAAMEAAFSAWALTVGAGMAPAFVATPPPGPVGFAGLFAEPYPSTHALAAQHVSGALDTWFRAGTATPSAGGAPVPWS